MRDPERFSPLYVLAPARSYSSVVSAMIGQHPELVGLPELKLFCFPTVGELSASLTQFWIERGITHRSPGLVRALAEFEFGDQSSASLELARAWLKDRSLWSGADVFDFLIERVSPRTPVEKSPENVMTGEALQRLASAYPRARYLHLTRDPVTTQRSLQRHWNRTVGAFPQQGQPMAGMVYWLEIHSRILRFTAALDSRRCMRIKAEDVLNDSSYQLKTIAAWLAIRTDEAAIEAMKHPEGSPFAMFGPASSGIVGGYDPDFLSDPIPRAVPFTRSVERPTNWRGNSSLWAMVVELATQLGYGVDEVMPELAAVPQ